ncbi:OsmC family protein [Actinocatenispora rupis]|uniref:Osmotically inducible protein C n=1 Tax=Actinocatenispora rupis TaxID=519421 RepID=A0A8J3NBL0_9ACTN|nr:OsmC family protein [Actinocatenispora rupis]GID09464.1 osmotically inducible protein C [Actinocatenispora rupis]
MAEETQRSVSLTRTGSQQYDVENVRGGRITIGSGQNTDFTPVELLLAAIAGCTAIDVDILTSRRAEPESFTVASTGDKIRDEQGNHMTNLEVTFRVGFPAGEGGDKARALLPEAVRTSHDRLCTVSRTVQLGADVTMHVATDD